MGTALWRLGAAKRDIDRAFRVSVQSVSANADHGFRDGPHDQNKTLRHVFCFNFVFTGRKNNLNPGSLFAPHWRAQMKPHRNDQ